jgi:hypothetical protein
MPWKPNPCAASVSDPRKTYPLLYSSNSSLYNKGSAPARSIYRPTHMSSINRIDFGGQRPIRSANALSSNLSHGISVTIRGRRVSGAAYPDCARFTMYTGNEK